MARDLRGDLYVLAQGACELAVVWPGARRWPVPRWATAAGASLVAAGGGLGLAGAAVLGRSGRLHPAPAPSAVLRTSGPYGLLRHPIYAGILSAAAGTALLRARSGPVVAVVALAAVLRRKAAYEDRLLHDRFGVAYEAYRARVPSGLLCWRSSTAAAPRSRTR